MTGRRVVIYGAGSIGCYLGGRILQGGGAVRFIGRQRMVDLVTDRGLRLSAHDREPVQLDDIDTRTDEAALDGAVIVALCVKSQDTAAAAQVLRARAPNAWVVSFQNGVSNLPMLRDHLDGPLSGSVVPFNVTLTDSGRFHRGTSGELLIGPDAPDELVAPLRKAGVGVRVVTDIDGYLWAKLLVNLNNAVNALWGGPLRDGLMQRDYRRVLIAMIHEGLAVAHAEGVDVATFNGRTIDTLLSLMRKPDWLYRIVMDCLIRIDRTARSSMLDDLEAGRASELDYLQGEIVRRAAAHRLAVPINRAVMAATRDAFAKRTSPCLSGPQMAALFLGAS